MKIIYIFVQSVKHYISNTLFPFINKYDHLGNLTFSLTYSPKSILVGCYNLVVERQGKGMFTLHISKLELQKLFSSVYSYVLEGVVTNCQCVSNH